MAENIFRKTAAEVESFAATYIDRLSNEIFQNDTISQSTWTVPAGIESELEAIDQGDTRVTIMVSGGTNGTDYLLGNLVVTAAGRTLEAEIVIQVRD